MSFYSYMEMETKSVISEDIRNRMKKLEAEMDDLRDYLDDITLSEDDIEAIKAGQRDFEEGKTVSL